MRHCMLFAGVLLFAGCSSETSGPTGGCDANTGCQAGEVCVGSVCKALCTTDVDCDANQICQSGTCETGTRTDGPVIVTVDGDGTVDTAPPDMRGTRTAHHLQTQIIVTGDRLDGASAELIDLGGAIPLTIAASTIDTLTADVPMNLSEGQYTLRVFNNAGEDQATMWVLQGEEGPALVVVTTSALTGDGTTMSPLDIDISVLSGSLLNLSGGTMTGNLNLGGNQLASTTPATTIRGSGTPGAAA